MRTNRLRALLLALLLATMLLSTLSSCSNDGYNRINLPTETKEAIDQVIRDFYQAYQQRDTQGVWTLLSTPSKKWFDEAAEKNNLDSGKSFLEHMFANNEIVEFLNERQETDPNIIKTRTLYGLVQCLVAIPHKNGKIREVVTLLSENGKWKIVFEFDSTVSSFDENELLLVIEPRRRRI